jgi:predicted ATPase
VALEPLTLLVGRNAAGKSNFLGALAFLRDVLDVGATQAVKRQGGWPSVLCRTAETPMVEIVIKASFVCGPTARRVTAEATENASTKAEGSATDLAGRRFTASYLLQVAQGEQSVPVIRYEKLALTDESDQDAGGFELWRGDSAPAQEVASQLEEPEHSTFKDTDWLHWRRSTGWPDLPAGEWIRTQVLGSHRADQALLGTVGYSPLIDLGNHLRWMGFYNIHPDAIRLPQKPLPGVLLERDGSNLASVVRSLEQLNPTSFQRSQEYLSNIAEEVIRFEPVAYGEYETIRFHLRSGSGKKPQEFDASSMSDGTLRALSNIMAAFQFVPPHGHPSVVGIEEPETALHPAALRAFVDALREATQHTQILLTTHSPDLLADRYLDVAEVLVVRSRDGLTQIGPVDPASREIVQKELYTLADLQRQDHLEPDTTNSLGAAQATAGNEGK